MKRGAHLHTEKGKALFGKLNEFFRVSTCVPKSPVTVMLFHILNIHDADIGVPSILQSFFNTQLRAKNCSTFLHMSIKNIQACFSRQESFLKVSVFLPEDVTIAYLSYLSWDFIIFNQSSWQIIQKKEEDNMIFKKCYKSSKRIKFE